MRNDHLQAFSPDEQPSQIPHLARHQHPVIEIEDHGGMVAAVLLEREVRARLVLRRDRAQAQRADIRAPRQLGLRQHLRPGEHRAAGEQRRDMASAVDRRDVKRVGEPVERERTRERDHMPAINQPAAEAVLALGELIEVHARRVLVDPRRHLMFGFLHRHAVHVVDLFADLIVAEAVRAAGKREVVMAHDHHRARFAEICGIDCLRQLRNEIAGRRCCLVALAHHHPAHIVEHLGAVLLEAGRADIDDAGLAARVFLQADDFRGGGERVARIDRAQEAAIRIAEIGDRVERDVGDGLAEHDVEHEQVVDRRARIADRIGERVGRLRRKARAEQRVVERDVAGRHGARRRVADGLAEPEVLEESCRAWFWSSLPRHASGLVPGTVRRAAEHPHDGHAPIGQARP